MANQTSVPAGEDERQIMTIVQRLPAERKAQILAFARFLAFETFQTADLAFLERADSEDTSTEGDARRNSNPSVQMLSMPCTHSLSAISYVL